MKILSGRFRNTSIPFRPTPQLRPTPDKVRLAIMAVLGDKLEGAHVLDLYAGTGALGLEALSRGAARAVFVEKHKPLCESISAVAERLGLGASAAVIGKTATAALGALEAAGETFDVILADPPYEQGMGEMLLHDLDRLKLLNPGAVVAVEVRKNEELPESTVRLRRAKSAVYGDTAIHYYIASLPAPHKA